MLDAMRKKLNARYDTSLPGFKPCVYRLLILGRTLELLGVRLTKVNYIKIDLVNPDAFTDLDPGVVDSRVRVRSYDFCALPLLHYAYSSSHLWEGNFRAMKAALALIRSHRKRTGSVPRALYIAAAETAMRVAVDFPLASNLLKRGLQDLGYAIPLEATALATLPFHFSYVKLHCARLEVCTLLPSSPSSLDRRCSHSC